MSPAASAESGEWQTAFEARERVQYFNNTNFDAASTVNDWLWTQRIAASAEGWIAPSVKARLSLQSAVTSGSQTSPVDSNVLDVREAYLEFGDQGRALRIGRQELLLGSQRLVGTRDGTNVRRGWDGARLSLKAGNWQLDAIAVALVDVEPDGMFNDRADDGRLLAGLYTTGPAAIGELDFYLLYAESDDHISIEGIADQKRYSVGLRSFGERGSVFWNWEAIYQWGRHGDLDITAWTIATNTGYRFASPWSPELMVSANVASGDGTNGDHQLGTFDPLYPRGNYFSDAAILGPANFYNVNPYISLSPSEKLTLGADVNWFWRLENEDGVYGAPGNVLRGPERSTSDFVAMGLSAHATYQINQHISAEIIYAHNAPGDFIQDTGPSDPVDFLELTLRFKF
ncbi:MAG: alginate export family protein [Pseudomonadota bacterium]